MRCYFLQRSISFILTKWLFSTSVTPMCPRYTRELHPAAVFGIPLQKQCPKQDDDFLMAKELCSCGTSYWKDWPAIIPIPMRASILPSVARTGENPSAAARIASAQWRSLLESTNPPAPVKWWISQPFEQVRFYSHWRGVNFARSNAWPQPRSHLMDERGIYRRPYLTFSSVVSAVDWKDYEKSAHSFWYYDTTQPRRFGWSRIWY